MTQNFLPNTQTSQIQLQTPPRESVPHREPVRLMLMGSRQGVTRIIHTLHVLGFAEVGEWSPLLPGRTAGEVMSILTRYFLTNS
ncbi:hypothetical protein IQ249_05800 [Lusitaniella coriacea LEGE 07157]|uniref:Peptide ABC transporter substrate-binding protein n=1 Tax=Lusitaniella coriacea LEGE 07157 TaxID=945747 RepID=A0A8J7B170_9CYAN|nr:hypothetical protein [Lusitaniella coriacea]MBE9115410.1 hypothetical protein [Lusitaniella coriacea LEGE 07157]